MTTTACLATIRFGAANFNDEERWIVKRRQPLSDEQVRLASAITNDDVRLDIAVEGFWSSHNRAIFDVRVFNPFACAKSGSPRAAVYRRNERAKIRAYEQRVLEMEHGSFTFLVLSEWKSSNNRHSEYAAFQATFRFCRVICQWSDIQKCLPLGEVSQKKKILLLSNLPK